MIKEYQQRRMAQNFLEEKRVSVTEFLDAFKYQIGELDAKADANMRDDVSQEGLLRDEEEECKNII